MLATNITVVTIDRLGSSKRERTRTRLAATALDLFERQGFDETTVAQIAVAAGVTEMTFFRHFPTKEQVVLDDHYDPLIAAAVGEQPRDLAPLIRAVRGIQSAWTNVSLPDEEAVRRRVRIVGQSPTLRAGMTRNNARTERLVADQLIADGCDEVRARVVTAAVFAGLTAALLEWSAHDDASLSDTIGTALRTLENPDG